MMGFSTMRSVTLLSVVLLGVAGCSSSRLSALDTTGPAPLQPAPAGTVTGQPLPPPTGPAVAGPAAFPPPPGSAAAGTTVAVATPPTNSPDVTASAVAGVWNASVGGQTCRVATPQTKFGAGFRAGPLRCPAPLDGVKSWNVAGKQLTLHDEGGGVLARLYSSGATRFDGQTESGLAVSLSR